MISKGKTALVYTCCHVKGSYLDNPKESFKRFDWLGKLIEDVKPDYTVDLGDFNDLQSLCSYDSRYPKRVVTQSYERDIEAGNIAQDMIWGRFRRKKKKRPERKGFKGNHEYRIDKVLQEDPRVEGEKFGISPKHLQTDYWYDEYFEYSNSAPALADFDGITYGHYVAGGNYGNAISGKHHAVALLEKLGCSVTVGHSHKLDFKHKADARPSPICGLVAGCYKGEKDDWAGQSNHEWTKGVALKTNIRNGYYDFQWISLETLAKMYGG